MREEITSLFKALTEAWRFLSDEKNAKNKTQSYLANSDFFLRDF